MKIDTLTNHNPIWQFSSDKLIEKGLTILDDYIKVSDKNYVSIEYYELYNPNKSFYLVDARKKSIEQYFKNQELINRLCLSFKLASLSCFDNNVSQSNYIVIVKYWMML